MNKAIKFEDMKKGSWYVCSKCKEERNEGLCLFKFKCPLEAYSKYKRFEMGASVLLEPIGERNTANNCKFYEGYVREATPEEAMAGEV